MPAPFARAWWSFELGNVRPCHGTYEAYAYDSIPPVDEALFTGEFQWLPMDDDDDLNDDEDEEDEEDDDEGEEDDFDPDDGDEDEDEDEDEGPSQTERLANLVAVLGTVDLNLPPAFVRFMGDFELKAAVPSCTGCEWDLSERLVESPFEDDAFLVRFLRDQQDCLYWYLHVRAEGAEVLCSPIAFDDPTLDEPPKVLLSNTSWVAPHFEHFVYRFWMENVLWELLENGTRLTPAEAAYVGHYTKGKGT